MLYSVDEAPSSNFLALVVRFLLPISTMENHPTTITAHLPVEEPPPDPPPRFTAHSPMEDSPPDSPSLSWPPDPPRISPAMPAPPVPSPPDPPRASPAMPTPTLPTPPCIAALHSRQPTTSTPARTLLAWNCQGSGGSLRSSTMQHLARLLTSTKP